MTKYTIADADALIERARAARPTCDRCTHAAKPTFTGMWEPSPNQSGWLRRCEKCANTPTFPWADKLDAYQVLAYMNQQQQQDRVWGIAELASLVSQTEWDFMAKQIQHWKGLYEEACRRTKEAEAKLPNPDDVTRFEKYADSWRDRALDAERELAELREAKKARSTKRKERDELVQVQLRGLQAQIDDLYRDR